MQIYSLKTAVLFLVFNRPDITGKVFAAIRSAKPRRLYVAADGPRPDRSGEYEKCKQVRSIATAIDWDCELKMLFRENNLGCRTAVSKAIDWFFAQEQEGIILEDDCLPHPSFFRFCEELLERYRYDERIALISGDNFQFGRQRANYSYYYSQYSHIWGWASWRRTWRDYDVQMRLWPEIRDGKWIHDVIRSTKMVNYRTDIFEKVYQGRINSWAYQLTFSNWMQSRLTILPNVNLITNIGFEQDATHTSGDREYANMPVQEMKFPLHHPPYLIRDTIADAYTEEVMYTDTTATNLKNSVRVLLKKVLR